MGWLEAIILAVVQGLTEFLPVSSSGHLVLGGTLLGMPPSDVVLYTVILHLASAAAIAVAYRDDWLALLRTEGRRLWLPIIAGTVPAALIGVLFEDAVEEALTSPKLAAAMLLVTAAMLLAAQAMDKGERTVEDGGVGRATGVGLAQALAMLPGISRSGSCLATGIYGGYERTQAVRFA
ncbi:MAG: undecaprenyl-diphosphate phosphatase, partial [Planctomycetota bacterium]